MSYAIILALVDGGPNCERNLRAGLALGQRFNAHVTCLFAETDPQVAVPVLGEGMAGVVVEQMIENLQQSGADRLEQAQSLFKQYCVDQGVAVIGDDDAPPIGSFSAGFRHVVGQEPDEVAGEGHLVDLLVLPAPDMNDSGSAVTTLDAALLDSGRPVLLVPQSGAVPTGDLVTIGWDGSRESARAVSCALPFLHQAKRVVCLAGVSEVAPEVPQKLLRYLAAHGITAEGETFEPSGDGMGADLLQRTANMGGDLLIMGAYGHSRLRELLLGGATHDVLKNAQIPVLMAH